MDSPSAPGHGNPSVGVGAAGSADRFAAQEPASPEDRASTTAGPAAAERLLKDVGTLRAELALLIAARRDQIKLALRRAFLLSVVVALAIVAVAILAASACVMLVLGIAGGVSELVGGRLWLGQLLTGLGFVIGGTSLGFLLVRIAQQRSRRKTLERYGKIER